MKWFEHKTFRSMAGCVGGCSRAGGIKRGVLSFAPVVAVVVAVSLAGCMRDTDLLTTSQPDIYYDNYYDYSNPTGTPITIECYLSELDEDLVTNIVKKKIVTLTAGEEISQRVFGTEGGEGMQHDMAIYMCDSVRVVFGSTVVLTHTRELWFRKDKVGLEEHSVYDFSNYQIKELALNSKQYSYVFSREVYKDSDLVVVKTASVGAQTGVMESGKAGTVTFAVETENLIAGSYTVTVENLPAGVEVEGKVAIGADGNGVLTLSGDTTTAEGVTETLVLTINGAVSAPFTLTIAPPVPVKTVAVGAQTGVMTAGEAGMVTFDVEVEHIAENLYTPVVANLPTGVTVSGYVVVDASGDGTLVLTGDTTTLAGNTTTLTLTIDGTTSTPFTLTIAAPFIP